VTGPLDPASVRPVPFAREGSDTLRLSRRSVLAPPETGAPPPAGHAPSPSRVLASQGDRPPQRCPPVRVAPHWLGCSLLARSPLGSTRLVQASRSSAIGPSLRSPPPLAEQQGSSLPSIRPKRTLSRGSTPCECPGCASRAALAVFHRLVAGARVRLSWGSSSLRRLQLQVPRICRDGLDPPREARGTTPPPGAALGFSQPLGGLSREDIRRPRVAPEPPFTPSLRPGVSRPCYMPRRPWDSPFRAFPSRGAVPPLDGPLLPRGFDFDLTSGAKTP